MEEQEPKHIKDTDVKQFIVVVLTNDEGNPVMTCSSRQATKELAIKEVYDRCEGKVEIKETFTHELDVDESGIIRFVVDGEYYPLNKYWFD